MSKSTNHNQLRVATFQQVSAMFLLIIGLFTCIATYWLLQVLQRQQKYGHIPGPSSFLSLPIVGHGYLLGSKPLEGMEQLRQKYGDVFVLDFGNIPTVFVCGHELISKSFSGMETAARGYKYMPAFHKIRYVDSKGAQ